MKKLCECPEKSIVRISHVRADGVLKRRLLEMGFLPGRNVKVIRNAPLRDPMEVEILGYHLTIRKDEAVYIEVDLS